MEQLLQKVFQQLRFTYPELLERQVINSLFQKVWELCVCVCVCVCGWVGGWVWVCVWVGVGGWVGGCGFVGGCACVRVCVEWGKLKNFQKREFWGQK